MNLELTILGYVLVPVTVLMVILVAPYRWWIAWVVFWAPFQAASVLDVGLSGEARSLQPGIFVLLALFVRVAFEALYRGRIRINRRALWLFTPLIIFAVAAMLSALILPMAFAGKVYILSQRGPLVPLAYNSGHLTQGLYVLFFPMVALLFAHMDSSERSIRLFIKAYLASGAAVLAIGYYQFAAWRFGFYYPAEIFNSGNNLQHGLSQVLAGLKRWSGPFFEPSMASLWLGGFFVFTSSHYFLTSRHFAVLSLSILSFVALMLTASATAAATLVIVFIVGSWFALRRLIAGRVADRQLVWALAISFIFFVGSVWLFLSGRLDQALSVVNVGLVEKFGSASYRTRASADIHALSLLLDTWGVGTGWGSNRASSLLASVLSNVGLWGVALLGLFAARVRCNYRQASTVIPSYDFGVARSLILSTLAMLLAGVVAVPDIVWPSLWLHLGAASAIIVRYARILPASPEWKTGTFGKLTSNRMNL